MKRQKRVLLLSNLPQRDWPTDVVIAQHLREMGADVRQANFLPSPREHILFYKPDIVIGPEARCEFTVDFYRVCKNWGIQTVVRRTEGGCPSSAWKVMEKSERDTVIGAWEYDVDLEIVWSEDFATLLADNGYIPRKRIFAAGAITFDQHFYPPLRQPIEGRRALCFCTNWGHADRSPEYNVPEAPMGSPIHADAYNRHREGRLKWIELMRKAREKLSTSWQMFLSLKVGELPDEYQKSLVGMNILMPTTTKVIMLNSDLIVQSGSTLALVAHLYNIPALSYMGQQNQTKGYDYPHVSPDFTDPDLLIEAIRSVELGKSNANVESIEILCKELYGVIDGQATKRAAERIMALEERPTNIPDAWPPETKEYFHPGVSKETGTWICEACHRPNYVLNVKRDMIKCVWCGISLAIRRANQPSVLGR